MGQALATEVEDAPAVRLRELVEIELDDPRWTALVASNGDALPFHAAAWGRLIADCYDFRAFAFAVADESGRLTAGLPVVETSRPWSRQRRWTSLPYTDYCPPLAAGGGPDETGLLVDLIDHRRSERGISRVELRAPVPGSPSTSVGFRHVVRLEADAAAVRARFKKKQVQQRLVKAERDGALSVRRIESREDLVQLYYALHMSTRRRLGVPVQPKRFFELVWERMLEPGLGWGLLAEAEGVPVAGAVFFALGETVVYKFGASERRWQHLLPNNVLLWHAIEESCTRGFRAFDFGRTDPWNDGLRRFKLAWGTEEQELRYTRLGEAASPVAASGPGRAAGVLGAALSRSPGIVCRATGALLYRYAA